MVTRHVFVTPKVTLKMKTGKRSYSSELRAGQARRTRRQIVAAAGELFEERGFAATTIDAVAARAGVSRKTVFTSVGNKVALLHLAYDYAMVGDDQPIPVIDRPELRRIIAEQDPWRQAGMYAEFVTATNGRTSKLWMALRGAAEVDSEARQLYEKWEDERRDAMRNGPIPVFVKRKAFRPGLTPDTAADIMWTLIDPALYHRLVHRAGWTPEQFREWLAYTVSTQILKPEPSGG
jgi:TetR/AcrR family transcriptional regulator, regulator of autoinduction and epiphytic fitness